MERLISILTNNIVVIWVAPIITGVVVAVVLKFFSIKKTKREIRRANQEYKEAILPYVLQTIILEEKVIHGIRDAICIDMSIPKKYMYSDENLMNVLIYDITKTRYSTEDRKKELIEHICKMFSFDKSNSVETERAKENIPNNRFAFVEAGISIVCIISVVIICCVRPEELKDPNGIISGITIFLMIIAILCFSFIFWNFVGDTEIEFRGIIGVVDEVVKMIQRSTDVMLFGKKNNKKD